MKGYIIGILEILLYFIGSITVRLYFTNLTSINKPTYFWVMMTILTGLWEISYISNYNEVANISSKLIKQDEYALIHESGHE